MSIAINIQDLKGFCKFSREILMAMVKYVALMHVQNEKGCLQMEHVSFVQITTYRTSLVLLGNVKTLKVYVRKMK